MTNKYDNRIKLFKIHKIIKKIEYILHIKIQ